VVCILLFWLLYYQGDRPSLFLIIFLDYFFEILMGGSVGVEPGIQGDLQAAL
jgi:hypothetical protein